MIECEFSIIRAAPQVETTRQHSMIHVRADGRDRQSVVAGDNMTDSTKIAVSPKPTKSRERIPRYLVVQIHIEIVV